MGGDKKALGVCYVIGAGVWAGPDFQPKDADFVLAADGGLHYLEQKSIRVDLFIGDGDSLAHRPELPEDRQRLLPQKKDDTDMLAALRYGWEKGYREFRLYGGTGGRIDHTLANLQCLAWLSHRGARGVLYEERMILTMIKNEEMRLPDGLAGIVSVFAYGGEATGVSLQGMEYPLIEATLTPDMPLGVSNEIKELKSSITVRDGMLLVCYPYSV